jgi:PPK2 family polyphosphate:nucleotide phosphotransferase
MAKASRAEGKDVARYVDPFRIEDGRRFRLKDFDPRETCHLQKNDSKDILKHNRKRIRGLQEKLYAYNRWSVLLIFQGMDAAGKDSAIEHVMSGVNPQGCEVSSFKQPSSKELDHDFLWRSTIALPERGRIGIFNRSYYEELLIARVHSDVLAKERLPAELVAKTLWADRFESIRNFEQHLARNGTLVLKFFLNVSKEEQRARFLERLDEPDKNWKFSLGDIKERAFWDDYQHAYEETIRNTSTSYAPWYAVPADHKWFLRVVISSALAGALETLPLHYPKVDKSALEELGQVKKALEAEAPIARSAVKKVAKKRVRTSVKAAAGKRP